jgi:hypothetical protein
VSLKVLQKILSYEYYYTHNEERDKERGEKLIWNEDDTPLSIFREYIEWGRLEINTYDFHKKIELCIQTFIMDELYGNNIVSTGESVELGFGVIGDVERREKVIIMSSCNLQVDRGDIFCDKYFPNVSITGIIGEGIWSCYGAGFDFGDICSINGFNTPLILTMYLGSILEECKYIFEEEGLYDNSQPL